MHGWQQFANSIRVLDRDGLRVAQVARERGMPLGAWSVWAKRRAARDIELADVSDDVSG